MIGKGWASGNHGIDGRPRNPAGPMFDKRTLKPPPNGIRNDDYAGNLADFLAACPGDKPFHFRHGAHETHVASQFLVTDNHAGVQDPEPL